MRTTRSFTIAVAFASLLGCTAAHSVDDAAVDDHHLIPIPDAVAPHDTNATCAPGLVACNGSCVRVAADSLNCGSCGNACPAHVGCAVGRCDCREPSLACDGVCIDPTHDHDHCGACNHACGATEMCSMGACIVECTAPGHAICTVTNTMGMRTQTCVDEQTDPMHCGNCSTRCAAGASCVAGVCTCTTGTSCMGNCVDLQTDANHCGTCYTGCGPTGVCTAGACTTCGSGLSSCGTPSHCVNTQTSPLNCGTCGNTCPLGSTCTAGVCMCAGGGVACGTACIDVSASPTNCGSCGHVCQASSVCTAGVCACSTGLMDCGGTCVDLTSNVSNCGGCGHSCGVGGVCNSGTCTCGPGYTMCDAVSCTNTQYDSANCGTCGHACTGGFVCVMGTCTNAPPTHYVDSIPSATAAPFIDACAVPGHSVVLPNADDGSTLVPLPFPFRYWATNLPSGSMINVSSNGFMNMDGVPSALYFGMTVPSTSAPNSTIFPHWGDDHTGDMGMCIATVGAAPNRQWVVEWSQSYYCCSPGPILTYEVVLNENSGIIDLIFQTMTGARAELTGLEDPTGTMGIGGCGATMYSCLPTTGSRVRYSPIP
jgi:hypothetical protein